MIMIVNTGFGLIKDSEGKIVAKYELPKGEHYITDGYSYEEVASKEELDRIYIPAEIVKCKYCNNEFYINKLSSHTEVCRKLQYAKLVTVEEKVAFIEKELGLR